MLAEARAPGPSSTPGRQLGAVVSCSNRPPDRVAQGCSHDVELRSPGDVLQGQNRSGSPLPAICERLLHAARRQICHVVHAGIW
jgi:hypothetical protein